MAPRMGADVTAASECLGEDRRVVDDVPADEEVRRRLIPVLEEAVERRRVFERLLRAEERRSAAARVRSKKRSELKLTPSSKEIPYRPSGALKMSCGPKQPVTRMLKEKSAMER